MQDIQDNPPYDVEETLRLFQARPHLFLGEVTLDRVQVWLGGFGAACSAIGGEVPHNEFAEVLQGRGWKESAYGILPQMREKGLSDEQIISELIEIEMALQRKTREFGNRQKVHSR